MCSMTTHKLPVIQHWTVETRNWRMMHTLVVLVAVAVVVVVVDTFVKYLLN